MFVSIDDGEVANLRKCCDEVFGEDNLIANIVWQKKYTRANDARWFSDNHDHVLCYAKEKIGMSLNLIPRNESQLAAYSNPDNHPKGPWKATPLHAKSGTNTSSYKFKNNVKWAPPPGTFRRFSDEALKRMDADDEIWFGEDGTQTPSRKSFLSEVKDGVSPVTIWPYDEVGHNHEANNELKALGLGGIFDNPKPTRLIQRMLILATGDNDIVLDFFAGSGTTAHAVFKQNAEDGANRRYILVQLPEAMDDVSGIGKVSFSNIADFAKERIRRAGSSVLDECNEHWNKDIGFRVLKIDSSNMEDIYYRPDQISQGDLLKAVNNIKPDRTPEDLLFQVLVDWGAGLTHPIRREIIQGKTVFFVGEGKPADWELVACFDAGITGDLIKELATHKALRVVFRDGGFTSVAVKINAVQIYAQMSPGTDVKSI
jgi:adenine-specific DNA-methyltransferase